LDPFNQFEDKDLWEVLEEVLKFMDAFGKYFKTEFH
jgi:hypothetical protein